ncbi:hypothetical protein [Bradyrhizobium sp. USDA 4545]|uniref:hypothetical protein n=1 Tax=Bradyrhizobium sp. USDA 4545 TaxID=2817705 RepID=UPI0020A599AD|nr:hypothetical protein [Bradyrhizobium sp. USDA 4545]MCP1832853.1 hypothetical protein [Bradyrhizobium sp. USDA 4545]
MFRSVILAAIAFACLIVTAEARPRQIVSVAHPDCNVVFPCEGVVASPRGEAIAKKLGFGAAQKVYRHRVSAQIVQHPDGCPRRAFCGCGAAVRVFGAPIRSLWLAAAWFKFPRAAPAPGMVAVRRHHVFVLEQHLGGSTWLAFDANSGGHATRIHARSIAGFAIVNPKS